MKVGLKTEMIIIPSYQTKPCLSKCSMQTNLTQMHPDLEQSFQEAMQ